jgi:sulfatase maturation enzyme AslB (radical SAM superfamily)
MYNVDGKVKNCIRSDEATGLLGNIKDTPIDEILLGPKNLAKQANIISNAPASGCHTCYDLEHSKEGFDIISDRIFYMREFKKVPLDTYRVNNFDLQTIDVRWTNLCNFACVYCGPEFSSKWSTELKIHPKVPDQQQLMDFKNYIYDHAGQLKHVYLAVGEPLLMK